MSDYSRFRVQPPEPVDVGRSLAGIMQMASAMEQQEEQSKLRQEQSADRTSLRQAFQPNTEPTAVQGGGVQGGSLSGIMQGELPTQFGGTEGMPSPNMPSRPIGNGAMPEGATIPGAQGAPRPLSREDVLGRLPGHLKPVVEKQFAEADEQAAKLTKLQDEADTANADYMGRLGASVKAYGYSPQAAQLAIAHAKQTYAKNPARLQQITQLEQQIQQDPGHIQQVVDAAIMASPEQQKQETARAAKSDYSRAFERAFPGGATQAQELAFKKQWDSAGQKPEKLTIDEQINEADKAGNAAEKKRLLKVKAESDAAGRAPAAESTAAAREAERWRANELSDLEKRKLKGGAAVFTGEFNDSGFPKMEKSPAMTPAEYDAEKARIEDGYTRMRGTGQAPAPAKAPAAAPVKGKNDVKVGAIVTHNGKRYEVLGIENGKAKLRPAQ